ncbi:MAG: tRNA (adenosine(37)-N6)-threonylcarbamoyltransferase complex dimerization subunit type 1 TsaB [Bacteroidia bacterium]|nr:tRNA (adenosine(37)-N6)-threonylcarbamoyltransferase complex dimerization subunit type 1 TsaB [Bacteroidia bacterium]MDW8348355.1 tRNA (adenosine(37)-N6)-threonylcarbamoyltransferase complex dimerization subunit type 1 TsaB [Bacteroidia bacterium]
MGIETATDACAVALYKNEQILALEFTQKPKIHSQSLTLFIEKVLSEVNIPIYELSAVVVSAGPGSYTGLRIGMSTAKGIAYALDIPLMLIPSTAVAAYAGLDKIPNPDGILVGVIDAPYHDVYLQFFEYGLFFLNPITEPQHYVLDNHILLPYLKQDKLLYLIGKGANKIKEYYNEYKNVIPLENVSQNMRNIGYWLLESYLANHFVDLEQAQPLYVKDFMPTIRAKKSSKK